MCIKALPIKIYLWDNIGLHNKDTFILKYRMMFSHA